MARPPSCSPGNRPLIYFDVTKCSRQAHFSGLNRVSVRLREALTSKGIQVVAVRWSVLRQSYVDGNTGKVIRRGEAGDVFFTPEVFALTERPFMRQWMHNFRGKTGCIFYDAIPFLYPQSTWPKSVRRFPKLLNDLNAYDKVFYISGQSAHDARQAASKLGKGVPPGPILTLGSDYCAAERPARRVSGTTFLHVGIIEPRKQQTLLLDACSRLWKEGFVFKVVLVGRVNPHFGKPIMKQIHELQSHGRSLTHYSEADDQLLAGCHAGASLLVSPSTAEGFGLPVLEALWAGCPVLASAQPACEFAVPGKGCHVLEPMNAETLYQQLLMFLKQPEAMQKMEGCIDRSQLPTWSDAATQLLDAFAVETSSKMPNSDAAV